MKGENRTARMLGGVVRSVKKGDYERAVVRAEEAHREAQSEETAWTLRIVSEFAGAMAAEVEPERRPRNAKSLKAMGHEFYASQEYRKAAACYGMAMVLDPQDAKSTYNRALALCNLDDHGQTLDLVDRYLALSPSSADGYFLRGVSHEALGNPCDAGIAYLTAMKLMPGYKDPAERLAKCVQTLDVSCGPKHRQTDLLSGFRDVDESPPALRPRERKDYVISFTGTDQATCEVTSVPLRDIPMSEVVLSPEVEERINDILDIIKHPDIAKRHSLTAPVGILLAGAPGTGKSYCAQAIACALGWNLVRFDYRTVGSMWSANTERNMSEAYSKIISDRLYPAIVLHDELDSLGFSRSMETQAYEVSRVNALIQNIDRLVYGDLSRYPVKIAATTNLKEMIDPALLRSGRLATIDFGVPDRRMRERLFGIYFKNVKGDLDFAHLAKISDGRTGADIFEFARMAKMVPFRSDVRGKPGAKLTTQDVAAIIARSVAPPVPGYR